MVHASTKFTGFLWYANKMYNGCGGSDCGSLVIDDIIHAFTFIEIWYLFIEDITYKYVIELSGFKDSRTNEIILSRKIMSLSVGIFEYKIRSCSYLLFSSRRATRRLQSFGKVWLHRLSGRSRKSHHASPLWYGI